MKRLGAVSHTSVLRNSGQKVFLPGLNLVYSSRRFYYFVQTQITKLQIIQFGKLRILCSLFYFLLQNSLTCTYPSKTFCCCTSLLDK